MKQHTKKLIIIGIVSYCLTVSSLGILLTNANTTEQNLYLNFLGEVNVGVGYKVKVENNRAYVSSNNGIEIIDIQDPTDPTKIGLFEGEALGFDVKDDILFGTDSNGLVVINTSNADAPEIIGTSDTGQWAYNTRLNNTLAFSISSGDIDIYDISNLNSPIRVGQYLDTGRGNDIIIYGEIAYYADPDEGLEVINVTDVSNPVKIRTISNTYGAWDLYIVDELLYLGCHGLGFKVIDISNPTNPIIIKQFNDGGEVYGVCGNETYIILGDLQDGVEVLNYSNPSYLTEVASYVATPHDIESKGNYIFVADQDNGFLLLELSDTLNTNTVNLYLWILIIPIIGLKFIVYFRSKIKKFIPL